jgi:polyhydroxybutyrate depolymerase
MASSIQRSATLLVALLLLSIGNVLAQRIVDSQVHSGNLLRHYRLYIPASYRPGKPVPLLLNIHALTSSDGYQEYYGDFRPIADTANFLILHPNGEVNSAGDRMWNVFDAPSAGGVDDVAYLSALIDTICARYSVDKDRIYSTGMSNGGFMSYELACQLNGRIAAVASVAGTQNITRLAQCAPQHPTPVLAIHGTADGAVPYEGTTSINQWASVSSILNYWVRYNGCTATPTVGPVPNSSQTDNSTVEHLVWARGRNGATVEHLRVLGGEHTWPSAPQIFGVTNFDISASVEIWRFLRRFSLNQLSATEQPKLSVWPIPVDDAGLVYVRAKTPLKPGDIALFDAVGRAVPVVASGFGDAVTVLDTHLWAKGTYHLRVTANNQVYRQKLIK